jgi:hypothetical protein
MDIETCIQIYLDLVKKVFPTEGAVSRSKLGILGNLVRGNNRFDEKPLESALKELISEHVGVGAANGEDTPFRFEASKNGASPECKV